MGKNISEWILKKNMEEVVVGELFPDICEDIRFYKYNIQAGEILYGEPEGDICTLYVFTGEGETILTDGEDEKIIRTAAVYIPDFKHNFCRIYATRKTELLIIRVKLDSDDLEKRKNFTGVHLPWYRTQEQCDGYVEKGQSLGISAVMGLTGEQVDRLGRVSFGICEGGCNESVVYESCAWMHRWFFCLKNGNYTIETNETTGKIPEEGSLSYLAPGKECRICSSETGNIHYMWIGFNKNKRGN